MTKWIIKNGKMSPSVTETISRMFNLSLLGASVVVSRGLNTARAIEYFITADIRNLHPTIALPEVKTAFGIIVKAIEDKSKIYIYGDYDVDGVTSTVILCKALRALGADVDYFIPDRHKEGYGLNRAAVEEICQRGCELLITCDNGIASKAEIARAKELGLQVVVFDHHEPPFEEGENGRQIILPPADAIVDMKLEFIDYPFRSLCAGGLCYKLMKELFAYLNRDFTLDEELAVFAALATICDIVELKDENRIIARYGLELINKTVHNLGLRKLIEANELDGRDINEHTMGFVIGPCINAGGRLEVAALAAELFMTEDERRAEELAAHLVNLNSIRKDMTKEGTDRLCEQADNMTDRVLVLYDATVDESIAGIIAGRVREKYNKPAIVLTRGEDGAKGSGRSIEAYDMFEELSHCREVFTKFGGHKMAAGMSLPEENVELLRQRLNQSCTLTEDDLERVIAADRLIKLDEVNLYTAGELERFKPYGNGNPEPVVALCNLVIKGLRVVGKNSDVVLMKFSDDTANVVSATRFGGVEQLREVINGFYGCDFLGENNVLKRNPTELRVDIMANLRVDSYNGIETVKLIVRDMRLSKK
jgi:single-stranded-DNA-specific exonuclease